MYHIHEHKLQSNNIPFAGNSTNEYAINMSSVRDTPF